MLKLLEDLKLKFPVRDVAPYGNCIVVPGDEFDPDWEAELDEQGYSIIETDFGDPAKPVTLVKLKLAPWQDPSYHWKAEEDELIIALWNQTKNMVEIHAKLHKRFPNRSIHAVKCRVTRLIKAGKIPGRWHKEEHKQKEPCEERRSPREGFGLKMKHSNEVIEFARNLASQTDPAYSSRDIAKKIGEKFGVKVSNVTVSEWLGLSGVKAKPAEPEPLLVSAPTSTEHTPEEESEVTSLLKEIRDLLQEKTVAFESYCPKCRARRSVGDSNVWSVCPVCKGPLIIWNVEASP